ncbi:ATP-dependent endonuclease [Fulvivirga sp. RKSG066]|uniref:ATP-dependent DNA helicase n=1 Tax=Fulvivirga aurantia TaxID=2529383 RepID=UPI0012BD5F0D|nr:AAA family ATPase [Fulvivirga aurantia]MTI19820.1 ATP-dependent endonuclease [Fulvivirga aurantia]
MPLPSQILINKFPYEPTPDQASLFTKVDSFLKAEDRPVLLIKGYAGTGKTTVVSALTQVLPLFNFKFVLLAPTGRAAKVMSSYANKMAFTIHKKIYKQASDDGVGPVFKRQSNYAKNTVFIIDESSMISEDTGIGRGLLSDLMDFVFTSDSNKLILIGDNAQLPPVGQTDSPALNNDHLNFNFNTTVFESVLTEVTRQASDSGILKNATRLREQIKNQKPQIKISTGGEKDIFRMTGEKMEEGLRWAYDRYGIENTVIICRSNKLANNYNQYIRNRIHFYESELEAGELLMVVRNNYLHSPGDQTGGFLANGDFVQVQKIVSFEEMYGFRFATLQLKLPDYPSETSFEAKVILDTLHTESSALSNEQNKKLYDQVKADYFDLSTKKEIKEALKKDPYLNALQVKFAYALTCHKSQGGQWPAVFVDQGFIKIDEIDREYVRWLYTAVTRATTQLFMVNFDQSFFH